jgi:hypothetical protein
MVFRMQKEEKESNKIAAIVLVIFKIHSSSVATTLAGNTVYMHPIYIILFFWVLRWGETETTLYAGY